MPLGLGKLLQIVAPKGRARADGTSLTPTYNTSAPQNVLTVPLYRDHLNDLFDSRQADDSRTLMQSLFVNDPDVSATVNIYLTLANTQPIILVRDLDGQIDAEATRSITLMLKKVTSRTDYTQKFTLKQSLLQTCADMRYMLLLRGGIGIELILDKQLLPSEFRQIDMQSIEWRELKPGVLKPEQKVSGRNEPISLDIPTFFVSFFRRDPTKIYTSSFFVSAINTIAARQQVINDLYRIMKITGSPRLDIEVMEEVLLKNAPADIKADGEKLKVWMLARLNEARAAFENIRSDQAIVHFDSVKPTILNDQKPGASLNIQDVINTLNAQNQAGLKTMATVIGRGTSGVNTGSVEARVAAMNADELNEPIADILSQLLSFVLHQDGYQGFVEVKFQNAELRPDTELEPQLTLKQSRLKQDLSDGLITDEEYHLWMYGRLPPDGAPPLSGTKFMAPAEGIGVDAGKVSPNGDPLGRSLAPEGGAAAKSKAVKK